MKAIDPNAVIDAIARLFPDGLEYRDLDYEWPAALLNELGIDTKRGVRHGLGKALDELRKQGRLRIAVVGGYEVVVLSHAEQARRVLAVLGLDKNPAHAMLELAVANVLAGKTEKKA